MDEIPVDDILKHILDESNELTGQLLAILEGIEDDPAQSLEFKTFAQIVDRIMGAAATAALDYAADHPLHQIAAFSKLCKLIGLKAAEIKPPERLTLIIAAFLLDATETLQSLIQLAYKAELKDINEIITKTFLERLQLLASTIDATAREMPTTKDGADSSQAEIDKLLAEMGVSG